MRIQHNIMAMNAYRNYTNNVSAMKANLEKLSSGYKINRAGDDAAGLAISEKMRAQITGLQTAQKNAKDGISLVQTAEGALTEVHDMLNRMVELATQSANGTYDNTTDRAQLQKEMDQLRAEIDRIADSSNFNGIKLLDGSMATKSLSALGELMEGSMIDGTNPAAAGKTEITIEMTKESGGTETMGISVGKITTGVTPNSAIATKISFTAAANAFITMGSNSVEVGVSTIAELGNMLITAGVSISDVFTISTGGNVLSWTSTDAITAAQAFELVAKNPGALPSGYDTVLKDAFNSGVSGMTSSSITLGTNEGEGSSNEYEYTLAIDITKLRGGEIIEFKGQKIGICTDSATPVSCDFMVTLGSIDASSADAADALGSMGTKDAASALHEQLVLALSAAGYDTDAFNVSMVDNGGTMTITITAKEGQGHLGKLEQNEFLIKTDGGASLLTVTATETRAYAAQGPKGTPPSIVWNGFDTSKLTVGSVITISGFKVQIVDSDVATIENGFDDHGVAYISAINSNTALVSTGVGAALSISAINDGAAIAAALKVAGFTAGAIEVSGTTLKVTSPNYATTAGAMTAWNLQVTIQKPDSIATIAGDTSNAMTITADSTTVADLKAMKPGGGTYTIGEMFDVEVVDSNGNTIADSSAITKGAKIKLTAKIAGKMEQSVIDGLKYKGGGTTKIKEGWDEGTSGGASPTHYELKINLNNIAGGQAFTFGNHANSKTFELSLDGVTTENNTSNNSQLGGADRKLIDVQNILEKSSEDIISLFETGVNLNGFTTQAEYDDKTGIVTLKLDAEKGGSEYNYGNIRYSSEASAFSDEVYNAYSSTAAGDVGTHAQVSYEFDVNSLKKGDTLTIGDISVSIGDKTEVQVDEAGKQTFFLAESDVSSKLAETFEAAGYKAGQISLADGKLTITDAVNTGGKAADLAKGAGKVSLTSTRKLASGGLTLQIGDTADVYNQLQVSLSDCHTSAMGISDISIADQDSAADAVNAIKAAINYVSDVRGTLGATQNRLDHTINNLSVMTENIQDAESTIRDTDVAEEMMAYTKNNILIQSAQAMLAQANQVPQGVLQLLQ